MLACKLLFLWNLILLAYYLWNIIELVLFLSLSFFILLVYKTFSRIVYMLNNDELYMLKLNKILFNSVLFDNKPV